MALDRDTFPHHVVDTSWAITHGLVQRNGKKYSWDGSPQVLPLQAQIEGYFSSDQYVDMMRERLRQVRFSIDTGMVTELIKRGKFYVASKNSSEGD